jgi:uncharacterized protein (TIGR02421 family)
MKINRLSTAEIIEKIRNREHFEASPLDGGFIIKINKYVPFCCTAIHNGGMLRKELKKKIALSDYERWFEEDPHTADFIASMPVTIVGLDSRFEYDLNRPPEDCIYEEAWGKKVWKKKLTALEKKASRQKHANYYKILHALINKIEELYGGCILYDIHSYNYVRWERDVPLFNLGTENIDKKRYGAYVDNWLEELSRISLPDIKNSTMENDVFSGRGYNLIYTNRNFKNTLVLATEIKKVYCDELNGDIYPRIIRRLQQQFKTAIINNAAFFSDKLEEWHNVSAPNLLGKEITNGLYKIDRDIYSLLRNFELLAAVNPINTRSEQKRFFNNKFSKLPEFKYQPIKINPFSLKQKLYSIPVHDIQDVSIRFMYESVVTAFTDKIDMLSALNSRKFLYNSLRYFGRPSKTDLLNANYLLHLPDIPGEPRREPSINAGDAMEIFIKALSEYNIKAKIELSNKVISHVMVLNSRKSILIQPEAKFRKKELNALVEHEIGVHMVTTINSGLQKLKVFNVGLPKNSLTQEGLAFHAEYLSGNITLRRLKKIAMRVIIVDMMCSGADFIECFNALVKDYAVDEDEAFKIATRIFRGGGFTKDYLYLAGFVKIFKLWREHHDLTPLLVGKTSLSFLGTIEEMLEREMIDRPRHITKSFSNPKHENNNPVYDYILSGLKE